MKKYYYFKTSVICGFFTLMISCQPIAKYPIQETVYFDDSEDICPGGNTSLGSPTYIGDIIDYPAGKLTMKLINTDGDFSITSRYWSESSSGNQVEVTSPNVIYTLSSYYSNFYSVETEVPDIGGFSIDFILRHYVDPFIPDDMELNNGSGTCTEYQYLTDECVFYETSQFFNSQYDVSQTTINIFNNTNKTLNKCY